MSAAGPAAVAVASDDVDAVDVLVDSPLWQAQPDSAPQVRRAVAAAAQSTRAGEVAIVLGDDSTIRGLNRDWRGHDKPTNVLSFPAAGPFPEGPAPLGDIIIAYETLAAEAVAEDKPFLDHLAHLAVHGYLHLVGYDHETDAEADAMETLERSILAELGIPDPYRTPRGAE